MARIPSADKILDAALRCAGRAHWERVRLTDVAAEAGCTLADIHAHFHDKESIVDALWDRADHAMLQFAGDAPSARDVPARIEQLVFAWLAPLAPHRKCVRQMLLVRLEPGHLHIQLPTLLRISKTVQWFREAADLRASFAWRALEESALTALFVATVAAWLRDDDDKQARRILAEGLRAADRVRRKIGPQQNDSSDPERR